MNTKNKEAHSDVEELLPWHAGGAPGAPAPAPARRYALVREELGETIHLNETLGAPSAHAMEKLFAKIDAEPARKPAVSLNLAARVAEFFASFSPRTLAYAGGAAVLAILMQAGFIAGVMIKETKTTGYETASGPRHDTRTGA